MRGLLADVEHERVHDRHRGVNLRPVDPDQDAPAVRQIEQDPKTSRNTRSSVGTRIACKGGWLRSSR